MILLAHCLEHFFKKKADWRMILSTSWADIVGALAPRIYLHKILKDNSLQIGVYDVRWLQEMYYISPQLIERINTYLGAPQITKLYFVLARTARAQGECAGVKKDLRHVKAVHAGVQKQKVRTALPGNVLRELERMENKDIQVSLRLLLSHFYE